MSDYKTIYETDNYQVIEYGQVDEVEIKTTSVLFKIWMDTRSGPVFASFFSEDKEERDNHAKRFVDFLEEACKEDHKSE